MTQKPLTCYNQLEDTLTNWSRFKNSVKYNPQKYSLLSETLVCGIAYLIMYRELYVICW